MNGKQHIKFGFIGGIFFAIVFQIILGFQGVKQNILLLPIIYFYTLLPDLDHKMSSITWNFLLIAFLMMVFGYFQKNSFLGLGLGLFTLTFLCASFLPHRGVTHSIIWVVLSPFLLVFLKTYIIVTPFMLLIAGFSYWIHLLCDGIPIKVSFKAWSGAYDNKLRMF